MLKLYLDEEIDDCDKCFIKAVCDKYAFHSNCTHGGSFSKCTRGGSFQVKDIPEEPKPEYETEYEWKKKTIEFLSTLKNERQNILKWLEENKPKPKENWEICNKHNTKVGDEVRMFSSKNVYVVKYIFVSGERFVVQDKITGCDRDSSFLMENYEINTAKGK